MNEVNQAYTTWKKNPTKENEKAWYEAVRRFSEICNYSSTECERSRTNKISD
jgi:hypothetical protein